VLKIYVPNDKTTLRIFPSLANEIGLNESLLLLQMEFWIDISTAPQIDGKKWTYQSVNDIREKAFPFWSRSKINRVAAKLVTEKLLIRANHNKAKYDRTIWFAINYEKLRELQSIAVVELSHNETRNAQDETGFSQDETRGAQNETTIPETTSETTTKITAAQRIFNRWNRLSAKPSLLTGAQLNTVLLAVLAHFFFMLRRILYLVVC